MPAEKDSKSRKSTARASKGKVKENSQANAEKPHTGEQLSQQQETERNEKNTARREESKEKKKGKARRETPGSESKHKSSGTSKQAAEKSFPVVGIGASAGGLESLEAFFAKVPQNAGMTFVVVTHTHPDKTSMLPEILQRNAELRVEVIQDGTVMQPDTIYLPPTDRDAVLAGDEFKLQQQRRAATVRLPIDTFFKSLAASKGERAACIILSGTGTDGTQGLRVMKEKGGLALVQSLDSAKYSGMPKSAIETGMADSVLHPSKMFERLNRCFSHAVPVEALEEETAEEDVPAAIAKIITVLAHRTGHDFSLYKKSTLIRRIQRRISVTQQSSAAQYVKHLYQNPTEVEVLFQDLLIGVTSFFRDTEAFDYLKYQILPEMLSSNESEPLRAWVSGCSTGEEVYSVAILLMECREELESRREIQIFGTDIDETSIQKAREGIYPQNIAADLSQERLNRFFTKEGSYYRARKEIREPVVFAVQNMLKDPPFSRLDLLICRNVLIYLENRAQKKLIPLFHYSLKRGGVLFLGSSETVGEFSDLFSPINKKWNIYRKKDVASAHQPAVQFPTGGRGIEPALENFGEQRAAPQAKEPGVGMATERLLLEKHTPPCAVINQRGEISYVHGRTGKYLEPAPGHASLSVVDMARQGLRFELGSALRKATSTGETIRREGLRVSTNGGLQNINLTVKPMGQPESLKDMIVILFEDAPEEKMQTEATEDRSADHANREVLELEGELGKLQQDHRTTQEELETSNEELKSVNEELQSSNEELQSTNEELESSREELQSLNEELSTVNAELHEKINELSESYEIINDVLNSTGVAILFVDDDLKVKRFTQETKRLINLIASDIERPLSHISTNLEADQLVDDIREVLHDLSPKKLELRTTDGHFYATRIMPFRAKDGRIDGAILTFINIDEQKKAQEHLQEMTDKDVKSLNSYAESILETVRDSFIVLDSRLRVVSANRSYYKTFKAKEDETIGKDFFELGDGQWNIPELRERLEATVDNGESFRNFEVERDFSGIGRKKILLGARKLKEKAADGEKILLAIQDVT